MTRTETATNDSSTESPSRPSRRKRWVAAASCVSLVAAASGAGYWSNYVYMSDVSAQDAAAHFASLIADGQYEEAFSLTDGSNPFLTEGFSTELLTDRSHVGAPQVSEVSEVSEVSTHPSRPTSEWFDTTFVYDDSSEPDTLSFSLRSTERRNGSLGMWQASFDTAIQSVSFSGMRDVRVGDVAVSDPNARHLLFAGRYRMEAHADHEPYWKVDFTYPLGDNVGELRTAGPPSFEVVASDELKDWANGAAQAFMLDCRTSFSSSMPSLNPADVQKCGVLALRSDAPALPPVDLISFEVHPTWFGFYVDMGETILKEGYRISTVYVTCDISFPDTSDSPDASCTVGKRRR